MMRQAISTWWKAYGAFPIRAPLCSSYGAQGCAAPASRISAAASAPSTAASSSRGLVVLLASKNRCSLTCDDQHQLVVTGAVTWECNGSTLLVENSSRQNHCSEAWSNTTPS